MFKEYLRQGFVGTVIAQGSLLGVGTFTGILVARILGPGGRGELAALILWPSVLVMLASFGTNQAIVYYTGRNSYGVSEIWTASMLIAFTQSVCVISAGLLVIPSVLREYSLEVRHLALVFLFATPFLIISGYPASLLQGKLELLSFNLIRMVPPIVYALGIAVLLALRATTLRGVVLFQVLGYILAVASGHIFLLRKTGLRFSVNANPLKSLLSFGWKTQLATVTSYLNQRVDQLLLSLFVSAPELGLYVVAVTVSGVVCFFPQAVAIVTLAKGSNTTSIEARAVIARSFSTSLIWLVASCSGLFLLAPTLITFVFGSRFMGSGLACRILLPGSLALGLNQVLYEGARSLNEPALPSYAEGVAAVLTCLGLYLLLPRLGFVGAAIASTLAYTASLIFMLVLYRVRLRFALHELLWASIPNQESLKATSDRSFQILI